MIERLPKRPSATAAAEHALREAIVSGELQPGDRLPPERVLSTKLGVSRLTLRAALATLAAAGLITVRHGSGYTVRDLRDSGGMDLLPGLVSDLTGRDGAAAAGDLLRLRRHLAAAVLEAIAESPPTAAARRAIHAAIDRFEAATAALQSARKPVASPELSIGHPARRDRGSARAEQRRGSSAAARQQPSDLRSDGFPGGERRAVEAALRDAERAIVDADLGVVRALLDATGSLVLRVCLNPIMAVLGDSGPLRAAIYAAPETNLIGWRALGMWIEKPDAAAIPRLLGVLAERDRNTVTRLGRTTRGAKD